MVRMNSLILIGVALACCLSLLPVTRGLATEFELPPMPPTIEELTDDKVKIGDSITKDNVDPLKEYLATGIYECVKNGMVLKMGTNLSPEKLLPRTFLEATERNKGKAVINDHGVVRLQDGSSWPGGMPFTEPKTGLEVMGYVKFGHAYDNWEIVHPVWYVNKEGKHYKTGVCRIYRYYTDARLKVPPLGVVPGMEDYHQRFINVFVSPLELKGLGSFEINHDDDFENYDIGFVHLPAFKRTIRVSARTYQDNVGGTDFTYGDPEGLREPFGTWNFKLIEKKLLLVAEPTRDPQPTLGSDGITVDPQVEWDVGNRFPRLGWTINPVYIVEATPKDKGHMYSKKVIYVNAPYHASAHTGELTVTDIYDRTGNLWKCWYDWRGGSFIHEDGEHYAWSSGFSMHDLQSGHQTHFIEFMTAIDHEMAPEFVSLKKLLQLGR